jgi:succinate dehydrogenase flavin-adding protein (antitoxin of CptAB toxin-antitoxin module)
MKNIANLSFWAFYALVLLASCQSNDADRMAEKALRDEIYAIHDEVMPKTSEINRLKRQLQKWPDEKLTDPAIKNQVQENMALLDKADEGMMSWMNNFKEPAKLRNSKSHEEIMVYLEAEKVTISQVKSDMLGSIESAKALLATLKQ